MRNRSVVYVKFPKTGLGNMLLLWARGMLFAKLNGLELLTSSWWGFRWGALLRREQKKRLYWRYFTETSLAKNIQAYFYLKFKTVIEEPAVEKVDLSANDSSLYLFDKVMTDYDLFGSLRKHRELVVNELYSSLHPSKKSALLQCETPVISIHVRRGDFKLGSTLTPLAFFIDGINIIRQQVGKDWPVTVFTDAGMEELGELLLLPAIKLAEEKADIIDILSMSKSKVLFLSAGSTFSYWAAFLSEAFVVRPMNDWLIKIKDPSPQPAGYFEMKWQYDDADSTLSFKENISNRQLKMQQ